MTDEQILIEALGKAVENGFRREAKIDGKFRELTMKPEMVKIKPYKLMCLKFYWKTKNGELPITLMEYTNFIFSHEFAKAFWGQQVLSYDHDWDKSPAQVVWKYHLQQMVLEENPINYLKNFI